jgi:uncharacterized protein
MQQITVTNVTKAVTIGTRIDLADTFSSRLFGLVGRREIGRDRGLLIQPSAGVHTFGMVFPIDVVALDRRGCVLRTWRHLAPFRVTRLSFRIHTCLKLAAGEVDRCRIEAGDQLEVVRNPRGFRARSARSGAANLTWRAGIATACLALLALVFPGR